MKPLDLSQIKVFEAASSPSIEVLPQIVLQGLNENGVVLLRGFNPDLQQFEELSRSLCSKFYHSGIRANYREVAGDNLTTRAFEQNCVLLGHSEGGHTPQKGSKPDLAFFMCNTPPCEPGGETIVIDGAAFLEYMPSAWKQSFATGIIYEMRWQQNRWQREFSVETIDELKTHLTSLPNVRYELHGEMLRLISITHGITRSRSGHAVFVPSMLAHLPRLTHPRYHGKIVITHNSNSVYFGDGKVVGDDVVNGLIDIHDAILYPHVWQKGDILILDNTRYMHGRTMTARNCERVIITRFGWLKQ